MNDAKDRYQKLGQVIARLLELHKSTADDKQGIVQSFIKNLYEVLSVVFETQATSEELNDLGKLLKEHPLISLVMAYLDKTYQTPFAYDTLNYFFVSFLQTYIRQASNEENEALKENLFERGLSDQDLQMTISHYKEMYSSSQAVSV